MKVDLAVNKAKKYLGSSYFDNLNIKYYHVVDQKFLHVKKNGNNVEIFYGELVNLFRGLTLIKENFGKENYDLSFTKHFTSNGLMLDCSRNGVAKISTAKELIMILALMGENRILLYTEDTYKLEKYPYFGYGRASYTKEDIKTLVSYGSSFGVTLIPCIQTLGHLERILRWEPFNNVKDGQSNLLIDEEKSYELIEEMIKFSKETFNTKDIHIGMDESFEMGLGAYLRKNGYIDRVTLFCKHLKRVISICKKYDMTPMIWSDMFFRLNSVTEDYYEGKPLPDSTLKLIPEGVKLVYWDYYHDKKEIYDNMNKNHLATNREIIFAGGAWRWKGCAPAIRKSLEFSKEALGSCVENNVDNVFVTAWGDNGNECTIYATLPILAQYSVFDYSGIYDENAINSLLKAISGETIERMLTLDTPDMPDNKCLAAPYNPSKYLLYQDPIFGLFDNQVKPQFAKNYHKHTQTLLKAAKESKKYKYVYKHLANLTSLLELKADLGVRMRKAYKDANKEALKKIANNEIAIIIKRLDKFLESARYQWNKENRSYGFDVIDGRLGYLKNRLISTSKILNAYLCGKIKKISELEEDILPYNGYDYEVCWNCWSSTVTPNNL